ncbi:nicotinamide riboside kinase 1 [Galleria mellonella]|uniref:Nicotinamide riboside kinase 1 n=1 Tax=Galleria mellonella TaxID=7137 RepID=A0ABM3MDH7_GALME|nr:nicotinamide riboside kinase 1 [Galleria mellonella]
MAGYNKDDWIVIGVSGVTCGGKTTLANRLKNVLRPVYVFHQDKYFYPDDSPKHVRCEGMEHNNYDILSALDMETMYDDIIQTLSGRDKSHGSSVERETGKLEAKGKKFLIVEGFTVMNYKPILELCNLRYYFVLEYGECVSRRCLRLYDPPDVAGYFERCVWPEHLKYRAQIEQDKRVQILDGTRPDIYDVVIADLNTLGLTEIR